MLLEPSFSKPNQHCFDAKRPIVSKLIDLKWHEIVNIQLKMSNPAIRQARHHNQVRNCKRNPIDGVQK